MEGQSAVQSMEISYYGKVGSSSRKLLLPRELQYMLEEYEWYK